MEKAEIFKHIDHTLLKAVATMQEIRQLCDEAVQYKTAAVCIPPSYVGRVRKAYPGLTVCTVIGFPLGYADTAAKVTEAQRAIEDGADEIDMVVNLGDVKNGDFDQVAAEIRAIRKATRGKILKVIIETCYLTDEEKKRLCRIVTEAEADYIKTSTGFGTAGATIEDVRLFKANIGPKVKIKAAGGVKTEADLVQFLKEGCDRIGTSSAVKMLAGGGAAGGY